VIGERSSADRISGRETSCKISAYNIQKEMGGNIKMVQRETGYEDWEWREHVQ
jgi:hypothetical protein